MAGQQIDANPLTAVPVGGVLLPIQGSGERYTGKPSGIEIDDGAWQRFDTEVQGAMAQMWSDRPTKCPLLLVPVIIVLLAITFITNQNDSQTQARLLMAEPRLLQTSNSGGGSSSSGSNWHGKSGHSVGRGGQRSKPMTPLGAATGGLIVACVAGVLGGKWFVAKKNKVQDEAIQRACKDLAAATGLQVEYRTANTACLTSRGKAGKVFRAIVIAPAGAQTVQEQAAAAVQNMMAGGAAGATMVQVQVPAGVGPGALLEVAAPDGRKVQAAVPEGLQPGQVFQVSVPPAVVQATVVGNVEGN